MENWQKIITNSTNAVFARRMIYKISEYQKRYPGLDVDSIAEEFVSASDDVKKEWATYTNNMKSIAASCRFARRLQRNVEYAAEIAEWNKKNLEPNDFYDGYCSTNYKNDF
jgi:hypothetical protein